MTFFMTFVVSALSKCLPLCGDSLGCQWWWLQRLGIHGDCVTTLSTIGCHYILTGKSKGLGHFLIDIEFKTIKGLEKWEQSNPSESCVLLSLSQKFFDNKLNLQPLIFELVEFLDFESIALIFYVHRTTFCSLTIGSRKVKSYGFCKHVERRQGSVAI